MAEKVNNAVPAIVEDNSSTDLQYEIIENADTQTAESMNESGIDYMWGSDQDDLIKELEKEK